MNDEPGRWGFRTRIAVPLVSVGCGGCAIVLAVNSQLAGAVGWAIAAVVLYANEHVLGTCHDLSLALSDQAQADGQIIEALTAQLLEK